MGRDGAAPPFALLISGWFKSGKTTAAMKVINKYGHLFRRIIYISHVWRYDSALNMIDPTISDKVERAGDHGEIGDLNFDAETLLIFDCGNRFDEECKYCEDYLFCADSEYKSKPSVVLCCYHYKEGEVNMKWLRGDCPSSEVSP